MYQEPTPQSPETFSKTSPPALANPSTMPSVELSAATGGRQTAPPASPRLSPLLWFFGLLLAALITPSIVGRIQYAITSAKEHAQLDVAREHLHDFNLSQISMSSRLLAQYVGPSVVNVRIQRGRGQGQGSGVIVDSEGYIVTNYHVVENVRTAEIQLSDGRRGPASVVGADPLVDVAVLKTELGDLTAAEWGDSDELSVGDMVWAFGSPFGLQKSITFGILSAKERIGIPSPRSSVYQEFLQTDAAVNPGNSGGPLVNVDGQIIGINTAIIGSSYQGISFSIPSSIARESYEQLRKEGWVQRGYLGVEPSTVSDRLARRLELERDQGVLVVHVQENTPADEAGMQRGDVILRWDGHAFSNPALMSRAIAATPIGTKVPVEIVRQTDDGPQRMTLTVQVAVRPQEESL